MILTEIVTIRGLLFQRTYSDENRCIVREGIAYSEAVDPLGSGREYTEGDAIEEAPEMEEA